MARQRLSNGIVVDYLGKIGSGELKPGEQLPTEGALCEAYGVGRSVAREALQALDAKGFILVRQGSVAVVAPRQRWQVLDPMFLSVNTGEDFFGLLQEAREILEPRLAALAAERITPEVVDELAELNESLATRQESQEEHAAIDLAFHEAIAKATDNAVLVSLHASISGLGWRTRFLSAAVPGAIDRAVERHTEILRALEARDPVWASAAMDLHLRQVRSELKRVDPKILNHLDKQRGSQP